MNICLYVYCLFVCMSIVYLVVFLLFISLYEYCIFSCMLIVYLFVCVLFICLYEYLYVYCLFVCVVVICLYTCVLFICMYVRAGGMSSKLVRPNLTLRTMQLNAWVADNFMNIEILFLPLIL